MGVEPEEKKSVCSKEALLECELPGLKRFSKGKVRDIYDLGEVLLLVASDRISAFDVVLPEGIPGKGAVLTRLSNYWFRWLSAQKNSLSNHLITADFEQFPAICKPYREELEGRSMIVRKARPLPVECIVRGYLAGSGWKEYCRKGSVSGEALPVGLHESERLPEAIFTPSTKAAVGAHDLNISFAEMKSMIGARLADEIKAQSLLIYTQAAAHAKPCGIIIADTKMEFGLDSETGRPLLIDELLTPDSSRFWPSESYCPGKSQPSFDKQFVRDYLLSISWDGSPPPPHLPRKVIEQTQKRYFEALERLTGI